MIVELLIEQVMIFLYKRSTSGTEKSVNFRSSVQCHIHKVKKKVPLVLEQNEN